MKTLEMAEATAPIAQYAKRAAKEPLVFTRNGKPVVALVSVEDDDWEDTSLSMNPKFIAIIERSRARQRAEGGISPAEMRRRLSRSPRGGPAPERVRKALHKRK